MPGEPEPRIAVLFALREEAAPFLRRLAIPKTTSPGASRFSCVCGFLRSRPVVVACSGAGERNAAEAVRRLLQDSPSPISCLVICGFAGGLAAEMVPGSLIVADRVAVTGDNADRAIYPPDSRLLAVAASVSLPGTHVQRGLLHTTNRILISSAEKKALAEQSGALAVDMETAGAVREAAARNVPWLAVRAITDAVDQEMPFDFNQLADAEGNVDHSRVILATLTHPWKIPALIRLGASSSRAARNLAAFVEAFLGVLPDLTP